MAILVRFRLPLLAIAMVQLLLLSSSATNVQTSCPPQQKLCHLSCYMPFCFSQNFPKDHPKCDVNAIVTLNIGITMQSTGSMSMKIVGNSSGTDVFAWQTLEPVSFTSEGDDPKFGHIVWSLDQPQDPAAFAAAEVSKIQANRPDELFPATCDIYFYVQATIEAYPEQVFRSTTPVHMRATELGTFNPHVNEVYSVVDPVDFKDENGKVAFTVTGLTSTLN